MTLRGWQVGLLLVAGAGVAWGADLAAPFFQRAYLNLTNGGTIGGATTVNGDLTVNGDAGVTGNVGIGGALISGAATHNGNLVVHGDAGVDGFVLAQKLMVPTAGQVNLDGATGAVYVQWGGANTVQFGSGAANAIACTGLTNSGTADMRDYLRNSTAGGACVGNPGSVCVNDSGGLVSADGSNNSNLRLDATGLTYLGATPRKRLGWMTSTNANTDFTAAQFTTVDIADATAVAGGGTCTPAADVTDDAYNMIKFPTDAAAGGHACGRNTAFTVLKATLLPSFSAVVRTDPSAVTSQTIFIGMVASSLDQVTSLAGANGIRGCWFRFDTGLSDTTWQACSSDGTTASCTDTTVSVAAATTYRLGIDNTVSGTCDFYVNGVRKVNKTSNINTANTALGWEATITARTTAARALSVGKVIVEEN